MRLLNVRLDEEDARVVRLLREHGVSISNVVRGAIRAEAKRLRPTEAPDIGALLAELRTRYPTPPSEKATRPVKASDRRAVQKYIRGRLRRRS